MPVEVTGALDVCEDPLKLSFSITLHFPDPTFGKNSKCVVNGLIKAP